VVPCEAVTLKGVVKSEENGDDEGMGGVAAISATHDPRHRYGHLFPEGVQRAHNHVRLGVAGGSVSRWVLNDDDWSNARYEWRYQNQESSACDIAPIRAVWRLFAN
jgi:hypothetical protein